ncbi:MAG: phosphatidylglycerol lysyltransferase domain-containing protein [Peptoniphilaceae bacterium]|nr:phosphatidylglycerol lysyltransferase domain-containing protein [Peptoniphilaceae bacterium]MDY6018201.1 phosphatidylglycerol lysyltransferase domain-containing protein [Anaerococcus sp.]
MLYILGVFFILSVTIPDELGKIRWINKFGHLQGNLIYQFPSIVFGILFIFLGLINSKKVKRAFYPTIMILILSLFYARITSFSLYTLSYITFCLILAYFSKDLLYKEGLVYSYEDKTKLAIFLNIIAFVSIMVMARNYHIMRINRIHDFVIVPFEVVLVKIIILVIILFISVILLNLYLRLKKVSLGEKVDFSKIDYLLETYPSPTTAGLVYLADKEVFYYVDENNDLKACLQFFTYKDKLIVMGAPFGDPDYYQKIIDEFIKKADLYDYNPIFYEISEKYLMNLHDYGFQFMKFGESASVRVEEFSLEGKKNKSFRNVINKFEKADFSFEVIRPPYDKELINKLKNISDKWLNGRKEMGFSLGFFDKDYLQKSDIAIVKDENGDPIAFANILPNGKSNTLTIDLMRFDEEKSPNGTMDYLFINLFLYCKNIGKEYFDLGMAPLYNVGVNENSFLQEKLAFLVYKFGDRIYSFEGLRNYKKKFATNWTPLYISYSRKSFIFYLVLILFKVERIAKDKKENLNK